MEVISTGNQKKSKVIRLKRSKLNDIGSFYLKVKEGMEVEYEEALRGSSEIISSMKGYNLTN